MKIDSSIKKAFHNGVEVKGIYFNDKLKWERESGSRVRYASRVASMDELQEGDEVILVCTEENTLYAAGDFTGRYFEFSPILELYVESIIINDDMTVFTLDSFQDEKAKLLFNYNGGPKYLKPYSASANGFTSTEDQTGENTDWTILIDATSSEATITAIEPRSIVCDTVNDRFTCARSSTTSVLPQIYKINK